MNPQIWADEFGSLEELTLSFDWNDSHSEWRLEELNPVIEESNSILKKYGKELIVCSHISDLIDLDKKYRDILYAQEISSDEIVTLLRNLEQLSISYDTLNMDSSFEFDSLIERITELLELWQDGNTFCYSEEEWDLNPLSYFENLQRSRYGLGERWSIKFTPESITMPDGVEVLKFIADGLHGEVFKVLTENDYCYYRDNLGYIAKGVDGLSDNELSMLQAIAETFNSELDSQFPTEEFIKSFKEESSKVKSLPETLEHISVFLPNWEGSDIELLKASLTL